MFYVKQNFGYAEVTTEITDENVFTRCPECDKEIAVDLVELFSDGEGDLFSTTCLCRECSKKHLGDEFFYSPGGAFHE
jgi:hypothetical protein